MPRKKSHQRACSHAVCTLYTSFLVCCAEYVHIFFKKNFFCIRILARVDDRSLVYLLCSSSTLAALSTSSDMSILCSGFLDQWSSSFFLDSKAL